jgi:HD-like signal output (HDOD) protein
MTTAEPVIEMDNETARLTVKRINAGLESSLVPMIGQILRIIRDISGKSDRMSVGDLVEFINGEPTIMARIVSIASSVGYNSSGAEINSVHHAISLIGFDRVRTLAISILLLESANSEHTAKANRELAGTALIGGLVAAEMCRRKVSADPDLAFICGALRNYGRMLAATFLAKDYADMLKNPSKSSADETFRLAFGLTPLELGESIMAGLQLPKPVLNTFVSLSSEERRHCSANASSAVTGAADFGLRFAEALQGPEADISSFEHRIELLSNEYDVDYYLARADIRELLESLTSVLESFRSRAGSYVGTVTLFRRLEALSHKRALPAILAPVAEPVAPPVKPAPAVQEDVSYDI